MERKLMTFENSLIKKYWPAEDKNSEGEIIPLLHIQVEAELDNSLQVGHLFKSMVRGLVKVNITHRDTGEAVIIPSATVKPFNVKQKKVKIGKGEDAAVVLVEFASMTIVTQLDTEGQLMKTLYPIFNREVALTVEDFQRDGVDTSEASITPDEGMMGSGTEGQPTADGISTDEIPDGPDF